MSKQKRRNKIVRPPALQTMTNMTVKPKAMVWPEYLPKTISHLYGLILVLLACRIPVNKGVCIGTHSKVHFWTDIYWNIPLNKVWQNVLYLELYFSTVKTLHLKTQQNVLRETHISVFCEEARKGVAGMNKSWSNASFNSTACWVSSENN